MRYTAETRLLRVNPDHPDAEAIQAAAEIIRAGGLVAFPTETVYGLGANATDPDAVARIFSAKRPALDPLIVHLASVDQLPTVALDIPDIACELTALMPGPLTLILKRHPNILNLTSRLGWITVGVRASSHLVAHALIEAAGVPIAAPSANRFSRPSATTAAHVMEDNAWLDTSTSSSTATPRPSASNRPSSTQPAIRRASCATARWSRKRSRRLRLRDRSAARRCGRRQRQACPRHDAQALFAARKTALLRQRRATRRDHPTEMRSDAQAMAAQGQRVGILATDAEERYFDDLPALVATLGDRSRPDRRAAVRRHARALIVRAWMLFWRTTTGARGSVRRCTSGCCAPPRGRLFG
ncbi:MAG: L-threonylcarbamoyladenylate synthase [Anaerolineae bacterium]